MNEPDDEFARQVQDALDHLYDYPYLQTHPLAELLDPGCPPQPRERLRFLRTTVLEAVEELNPGPDVPFRSLQARSYNVLNLRYVEGLAVTEVARELAVSERQLYRDLRKAEQDLAALLWVRRKTAAGAVPERPRAEMVLQEAERLGYGVEEVRVRPLVEGVLAAVASLSRQRELTVDCRLPATPLTVRTDRLLARQVLIGALSAAVQNAATGTTLRLNVTPLSNVPRIELCYTPSQAAAAGDPLPLAVRQLVRRLGGRCSAETRAGGEVAILLALARPAHATLLVIDDNAGLLDLFRRYLADQPYRLLGAYDGEEGLRLAAECTPDAIVLDVMMPQVDGWEVLQLLRNREQTRNIPVVVCSVLDDPQLALSLGAVGYLAKPVNRTQLLRALGRCFQEGQAPSPPESPAGGG